MQNRDSNHKDRKDLASMSNYPAAEIHSNPLSGSIGEHDWTWKGKPVTLVYEVYGKGKPILLLPAPSTVSSRSEMRELATLLCHQYQVFVLDWVGFGDSSRPAIAYTPAVFEACLRDFVQKRFKDPIVVVAAGHAATYVMELAHKNKSLWSWAVLVAPTWRGPLPTAMGEKNRWFYKILQQLINLPIVGQLLYFLNTSNGFLKFMYSRHVFTQASQVTQDFMQFKQKLARRRGARFASAAFVTGALDAVKNQEAWLSLFQPLPIPVMMAIGEQTPPKSRQEMEVVAHFSAVQVKRMPGSLGLHEEFPQELAGVMLPFLEKYLSRQRSD
jgi:pimeloyl-ACP methyl ester carboxylesterase